jgi:hypothetical protein
MKKSTIYILLSLLTTLISAQEIETDISIPTNNQTKNIIYSNAEYYLLGGAVNISYERFIRAASKYDFSLRGTYGRWIFGSGLGEDGDQFGNLFKLTGNLLFFKGNNHLEVNVGAMMLLNDKKSTIQSVLPDLFCGYTYKKPDGHFVFKTGFGILGFLSIGIGFAF